VQTPLFRRDAEKITCAMKKKGRIRPFAHGKVNFAHCKGRFARGNGSCATGSRQNHAEIQVARQTAEKNRKYKGHWSENSISRSHNWVSRRADRGECDAAKI
jgi:hypothetical protein